jgi:hypothetical protein
MTSTADEIPQIKILNVIPVYYRSANLLLRSILYNLHLIT